MTASSDTHLCSYCFFTTRTSFCSDNPVMCNICSSDLVGAYNILYFVLKMRPTRPLVISLVIRQDQLFWNTTHDTIPSLPVINLLITFTAFNLITFTF